MTEAAFNGLAASIAELNGIPVATASRYAAIIGDTPEIESGLAVVRDEETEEVIARVRLA